MIEYDEFDDDPDDAFGEDDDQINETLPCPHCGEEIYEDADRCPHCGNFITFDTSIWTGRPWWWIALGLLGILAVIFALSLLGTLGGG